jgi:hypothetical protein
MVPHSLNVAYSDTDSQVLWEDSERAFRRGWRLDDDGKQRAVLVVTAAGDHPSRSALDRLMHEYELKDALEGTWAVRPLELVRDGGRTMLLLEDAGSVPIDRLLGVRVYRKPNPSGMPRWNRLSWRDDQAVLFRSGRPGLAVQVEVTA